MQARRNTQNLARRSIQDLLSTRQSRERNRQRQKVSLTEKQQEKDWERSEKTTQARRTTQDLWSPQ
jgi:hypothetical protein